MGFVTCFLKGRYSKKQEASQKIKVKLNESRLLEFYQVKQLKKIQPRILSKRTLKKTLNYMNTETFQQN